MENTKSKKIKTLVVVFTLIFFNTYLVLGQNQKTDKKIITTDTKYKVTFIEFGSVRCKPCQKMQPIIKSIEEKYSKQVNVLFYDVWTPEGKENSKNYVFTEIPTQIFLDSEGREYYRHTGFFSQEDVIRVLKQKGVK